MATSFDSYRLFYYVGKYKNITRAAEALFLSQSTVSRSMQSLEAELGIKLFERSQHGIILTREGEVLFEEISKACELIFSGEEKVHRMQQFSEGSIRVGVNDFTFQSFILPVLKEFHTDFPSVRLEISSVEHALDGASLTSCFEADIDFACLSSYPGMDDADVEREDIAEFNDILIAGKAFQELRDGSYYYYDITSRYPFVCRSDNASGANYVEQLMREKGINFCPAFNVNNLSLFAPMVAQGLCLAVIPSAYLDNYRDNDDIFEVKMKDPLPSRCISIVTSSKRQKSAASEEFIKRVKKYVNEKIS